MRISDWSSDVCSSDLLDPEVRIHARALRLPARHRRGAGVVGGDGEVGLAVLVFHLPQVGGADDDVGVGVVQALGSAVGNAVALGDRGAGGRQHLHPAARVGGRPRAGVEDALGRSEEHTSELQSLMRTSYAVFWLKKKK